MGTIRRLTDIQLGSIQTTKVINLTTAGYVFQIGSGNRAFEVTNLSQQASVYYGNAIVIGTGAIIQVTGSKFWDTIVDNFTMTFYASSANITLPMVIQEYAGN